MSSYHCPRIPAASVFFTVTLAQRGSGLLVDEIDRLREAVAAVRSERPFVVGARGGAARPHACGLDLAGGGCGVLVAVALDQSAVFTRGAVRAAAAQPRNPARAGDMAAPVLGASHPEQTGICDTYPVVLQQSGEARSRRTTRGLAVFVSASGHPIGAIWLGCVTSRTSFIGE
jgi:hypothetical protein